MSTFTSGEINNYINNVQTNIIKTHLQNDLFGSVDTGLAAIIDIYSEFIITNYFSIVQADVSLINSLTKFVDYLNQLEEIRLADPAYMTGDFALQVVRSIYYLDYWYYKFITPVNSLLLYNVPPSIIINNYHNDFIRINLNDDFINMNAPDGLNNIIEYFSPVFAQRLGNSALASDEVKLIKECIDIINGFQSIINKSGNGDYTKETDYLTVLLNSAIIDSVYTRIFTKPTPSSST